MRCRFSFHGLLCIAFCLSGYSVRAQSLGDTLKEVHVTAKQTATGNLKVNQFSPGQKVVTIDSVTLQQYRLQNISTLLAQQVPVFIKAYSFNGLSTLNFRGASAAQSQVLWNGIPIQNAAMGIADVSSLPVMFMSRVSMVYGGSSALWGSGNVGGALLLENDRPVFDSGHHTLSLSGGAGSFGQYMAAADGAVGGKKWFVSLKALGQTARNDFPYTDVAGKQAHMPNSGLHSGSVMVNSAFKTSAQSLLSFSAWFQDYYRQVPPALYETYSVKSQEDASLRLLLDWNTHLVNGNFYARSSFIRDDIHYNDSAVRLHTVSTSFQYYQETGWRHSFGLPGQVMIFIPVGISWMNIPVTAQPKQQSKVALACAYDVKTLGDRLDMAVNARAEMADGKGILLPGADASCRLTEWLTLRANVQRSYRIPTLNELYYYPGGNTSLKPEQGWSEDAGYALHLRKGAFSLSHDLSVFTRDVHDWIIWLGSAIWTPHNIAEVHSRGVETTNTLQFAAGRWRLHLGVNTAYTLATTVQSYIAGDGSVGRQIPYTPRYNGQLNVGFALGRLYVNYNHTYTGYRFTVSDESEYLLPYNTGNMQVMYTTNWGLHSLQCTVQCNNVWNQQYSVIGYRPMPGINWLAGFRVQLW